MIINDKVEGITFCPYIRTEETIIELLKRDKDLISDDFELMPFPLAHWINTYGIHKTNELISNVKSDKRRVFICQHIYVNNLIFEDSDIVFTPHSSFSDNYVSIPHYTVNSDNLNLERDILYSFLGSISTHPTRKLLVKYYDNCYNSNVHWGLDKKLPKQFNNNYIELTNRSVFSFCPRGTGISSVRLFESMSMGSVPIIIADNYQPPLYDKIDWSLISLQISEQDIMDGKEVPFNKIFDDIDVELPLMRERMLDIYNKYFSNENLHKTVLEYLCDL